MFESFKKIDRQIWLDNANKDLKDTIDVNNLVYKVDDITVSPFLTHENVVDNVLSDKLKTIATAAINANLHGSALKGAEDGAAALFCEIDDQTDLEMLCQGLYVDLLDWIVIDKSKNQSKSAELRSRLRPDSNSNFIVLKDTNNILKAEMTAKDRLKLSKGCMEKGIVILELKKDFLAQIAELRSIRIVYNKNFGENKVQNSNLKIICKCPTQNIDPTDRQSLIAINYMMMSAHIGGANYVISLPYGEHDDAMARWSLNIQHILTLESGLTDVQDPTAGSYLIESLTNEFIAIMS